MLMLLGLILSGLGSALTLRAVPDGMFVASSGLAPHSQPIYLRAERDAQVLHHAKEALLAYTVTYADNYNPTGAGPGHLPCPDLDPPDDGRPGNDGPNPPCSRDSRLTGRVPRLTRATRTAPTAPSLAQNNLKVLEFYPLLTHLDQQPWYRVAGEFVNNPLNRTVNPSTVSSLQGPFQREVMAALVAPGPEVSARNQERPSIRANDYLESTVAAMLDHEGQLHMSREHFLNSNDIVSLLYLDDVLPLVIRRVAGFLREQLYTYRDIHCPQVIDDQNPVSVHAGLAVCFPYANASRDVLATTTTTAAGDDDNEPSTECVPGPLNGRLSVESPGCPGEFLVDGLLQGVEPARHWLVRNGWLDYFLYRIDPDCVRDYSHRCEVKVTHLNALPDGQSSAESLSATIHVRPALITPLITPDSAEVAVPLQPSLVLSHKGL